MTNVRPLKTGATALAKITEKRRLKQLFIGLEKQSYLCRFVVLKDVGNACSDAGLSSYFGPELLNGRTRLDVISSFPLTLLWLFCPVR